MPDLSTQYMGLALKNPIIVSSSDLTKSVEGVKKCEDAGAGAVVLKSVFEEQLIIESNMGNEAHTQYPEALDYFRSGGLMEYAPQKMCDTLREAKIEVDIPIIASINCQTDKLWPNFARQLQEAGADALELNIYTMPFELDKIGVGYEDSYLSILKEVKKDVSIPISVKMTPEITSLPYFTKKLADAGCDAVVLFNWFLESDIDVRNMKTRNVKGSGNFRHSLRWVALLSGRIGCDISSSGGVKTSEDVIKQILSGASAVQVCSLFYQKGVTEISGLLTGLLSWMEDKQFGRVEDFKGELSFKRQELSFNDLGEAGAFFRSQYLKTYSK